MKLTAEPRRGYPRRSPPSLPTRRRTAPTCSFGRRRASSSLPGGFREDGTILFTNFIPGYSYVDTRTSLPDGTASWTSSVIDREIPAPGRCGGHAVDDSACCPNEPPSLGPSGRWRSRMDAAYQRLLVRARSPVGSNTVRHMGRRSGRSCLSLRWHDVGGCEAGAQRSAVMMKPLTAIAGLPSGEMWVGGHEITLHRTPGANGP